MSYEPPSQREFGHGFSPTIRLEPAIINPLTVETPNISQIAPPVISQPIVATPVTFQPQSPPVAPIPSAGVVQQTVYTPHQWSTPLFDCLRDEESCWWSFWCCWVISARNTEEFRLGSAKKQILWCVGLFFVSLLLLLILGPIGPLFLIGAALYYVYYRTNNRQQMKAQLHILSGEWMSDFLLHCCCTACTIAQEARESLFSTRNRRVDYCSSQEMSELAPSPDNLFDDAPSSSEASLHIASASASSYSFARERWQTIYTKLSHSSQNILIALGVFFSLISLLLLISSPLSFVVLLLVFLQPLLVLYFVYWRGRRRFAQLDYVVKLFCVGFFLSTTQSVVFEHVLQQILVMVGVLLFFLLNGSSSGGTDVSSVEDNSSSSSSSSSFFSSFSSPSSELFAGFLQRIAPPRGVSLYSSSSSSEEEDYSSSAAISHGNYPYDSSSTVAGRSLYRLFSYFFSSSSYSYPYSYSSSSGSLGYGVEREVEGAEAVMDYPHAPTVSPSSSSAIDLNSVTKELLRENILLVLFMLFLMAFIVAAGVEETMKHFAVRCCRFPSSLKDPHIVLVYLVSAALGFATAENIEYVFGVRQSPIPGTSRFVGEIVVLAMRLLMPIHLICSVLQAANLSRVVLGINSHWNLPRVMMSAILLHGSFDYFLFASGAIQFAYDIDSVVVDVLSVAIPILITVLGIVFAYRSYSEVEKRYAENWRTISTQDDESAAHANNTL